MKKRFISIRLAVLKALAGSFVLLALLAFVLPQSAHAILAANTQISNTAHLSYNDGTGTKTADATPVVVAVALVPAAPNITSGADQTTVYSASATTTDTFTIIAGSNGPDTYNLSVPAPTLGNTTGATFTTYVNGVAATSVELGASLTLAGSTTTSLVVPSDGTPNAVVNGIEHGDLIVVGTETVRVDTVTDNGNGTTTITLDPAYTANPSLDTAPGAAVPIYEQKTITVTVDPTDNTGLPGQSVTVTDTITATSVSGTHPATTCTDTVTNTFTNGLATLTKYVRNATLAVTGTGTPVEYPASSGTFYYPAGVTGKSGDTLEYILVAHNSGTGPVTASVITDALPTSYVTIKGTTVTYVNESNVPSTLTTATGDDMAQYDSGTLTVNVGTSPVGNPPAAGGTIASGGTVSVLYQVTINN